MNELLHRWNNMAFEEAVEELLPCNGSAAWAQAVTRQRPFARPEPLFRVADAVWRGLPATDWQQAFASHPRLGESHAAATVQSLAWSHGEQSALTSEEQSRVALAAGNREYEARFGRVFLLCATGKNAAEMLAELQRRLPHDAETEAMEAAEQQRRITQLRLRKWLGLPAAGCEEV